MATTRATDHEMQERDMNPYVPGNAEKIRYFVETTAASEVAGLVVLVRQLITDYRAVNAAATSIGRGGPEWTSTDPVEMLAWIIRHRP